MSEAIFDGVPVRIYEPVQRRKKDTALLHLHGSGWVCGTVGGCTKLGS